MTVLKFIRVKVASLFKRRLPAPVFYKLRNIVVTFEELMWTQLVMMLPAEANLPDLKIKSGLKIRSFKEYPALEDWIRIVNGSVGEWDPERAKYLFLGDKYFCEELCFILLDGQIPVATATGRIRVSRGEKIGELHMVAVRDDHRCKGLGLTVSLAALHAMRSVLDGPILLKTDPWRIPAIKMYWKLGFRPLLKRWHFKRQKALWESIQKVVGE